MKSIRQVILESKKKAKDDDKANSKSSIYKEKPNDYGSFEYSKPMYDKTGGK